MKANTGATISRRAVGARWAIVLAGGEGRRMRDFVEAYIGESRPKQYCAFHGEQSMVQMTIDRALGIVSPENLVTVIGNGHTLWLKEALDGPVPGNVIEQPSDHGTAAGLLAGISFILEQDSDATILVMPSDLFIRPTDQVGHSLRHAFKLAEAFPSQLVLLGAAPDHPETDYGWILAGERVITGLGAGLDHRPRSIRQFVEKPDLEGALSLLKAGAMWNAMLIVGHGQAFWRMIQEALPALVRSFTEYRLFLRAGAWPGNHTTIDTGWIDMHRAALNHTYARMESADFSADVLSQLSDGDAILLPIPDVEWSDWGRPERVYNTLIRSGLKDDSDWRRLLEAVRVLKREPAFTN